MPLGLPPINNDHKNTPLVRRGTKERLVHYKWKLRDIDHKKEEKQKADVLIEILVALSPRYETRYVVQHSSKRIRRLIRATSKFP
jgi:hypothetical protein